MNEKDMIFHLILMYFESIKHQNLECVFMETLN